MRDVVRICFVCERTFSPRSNRQQCCSFECGRIRIRDLPEQREKSRLRANEWYRKNRNAVYAARKRKPPIFLPCKHCGTTFQKKTGGLFCSKSCVAKYRRKTKPEWYKAAYLRHKNYSNRVSRERYYKTKASAPWEIMITMAKVRAKKEGLAFDLTNTWGAQRWTGHCEMTGLPFKIAKKIRRPFSPSIDKIEAKNGYVQSNCRFVLWAINTMKGVGTDEEIFSIAKALISKTPVPSQAMLSLPG